MELNISIDLPDEAGRVWTGEAVREVGRIVGKDLEINGIPLLDNEQRHLTINIVDDSKSVPVTVVVYRSE